VTDAERLAWNVEGWTPRAKTVDENFEKPPIGKGHDRPVSPYEIEIIDAEGNKWHFPFAGRVMLRRAD